MTLESMTPAVIRPLVKGDLVYYASPLTTSKDSPYLSQLTQVEKVNDTTVFLDNGKKFSIERKEEICRGESGCLYEYSAFNKAIVKESEAKLSVLKSVEAIDFSSLTSSKLSTILDVAMGKLTAIEAINFNALSAQQVSMIVDVARGAFTQVANYAPCGGGCGELGTPMAQPTLGSNGECYETMESDDQVQVGGLAFDIGTSTNTPVVFADATFELSDGEEEEDEEDDDDTEAVE